MGGIKEPKKITAHRCEICGNLVGGITGIDYQIVTNRGQTRYYCEKCVKAIMRGE